MPFLLTDEYCFRIRQCAYIGQKGFTVLKSDLHPLDIQDIQKELFKIPILNGLPQKQAGFAIYRENERKLYLPRFYAIERYRGPPIKSDLDPLGVTTIHCPFDGTLNPSQIEAVEKYKSHIATGSPGGILELPCGYGKCLAEGTLVIMWNGSIQPVENVKVGDLLMGDDMSYRRVLTTSIGEGALYRVSGGDHEYVANADHILSLCRIQEDGSKMILDISIQEYLYASLQGWYGYRVPVEWPIQKTSVPPYWMGYGCTSLKSEDEHELDSYIINSREIRLAFLAGILDTSTNESDVKGYFSFPKQKWIRRIVFLCHSLGIDAEVYDDNGFRILDALPLDLRKHLRTESAKRKSIDRPNPMSMTYPIVITFAGKGRYYGFEIDGNRRFLLSDLSVTHNTVLSIHLIAELAKKTMILVHKEFLMNQWIDRIQQFMPTARVGILQGKKREWGEDVDICIGMIQSIYNKEFAPGSFSSFGLTIIDEVHRIGSAEFSGVLSRIVTPLMLGISATVERKDRLTDILYAFIGPKIYSVRRRQDDCVQVKAIEFQSNDEEFKTVEIDYKGQVKYSTMISKLCAFAPRSDFIVKVLLHQYHENPDAQMIVLCHNRCLLVYIYDILTNTANGPTVGYYVGGMKPAQLEMTETKEVVLATYAMASEALDIKTLSTLFLITPKTDIVQSVGRILRMKHRQPLIVDFIDTHKCFQNQWAKRRQYYKQCHYDIWKTNSHDYPNNWKKWTRHEKEDKEETEMASYLIDESVNLIDV